MPVTQESRHVGISTPLGDDVLLFKKMVATEELGRLFSYDLQLLSEKVDISFDDIVGENVTVRLELGNNKTRYFNGYVSRFAQMDAEGEFARYNATVVPWLWFLTQSSDCRIFQNKTVPDIIEEVFNAHGFDKYELRLSGDYRTWEYCVQYQETDFNFVSRLMEQEGIYYFFLHENGEHKLALADSPGAHESCPGYEEIVYRPPEEHSLGQSETIQYWSIQKLLRTTSYIHNDFDFKNPKANLLTQSQIPREHTGAEFAFYDGLGEYVTKSEGEEYAKIRIEEIQAHHQVFTGKAGARGIVLGHKFNLTDSYREDQNREYVVIAIHHEITSDVYGSSESKQEEDLYNCSFTAIEPTTPFRPSRRTPKSVVNGPQTAMVVGPSGDEIYTDEYGRVKVQFHWDRDGQYNENSSCWIRVAQHWAGKKWGAFYLPRIGQEVIVEFLDGDPDRPFITGRVYNGENMPPYPLPDNKTLSTLKSNSSKGGQGFNEIRFEDKKDEEQIFIHAQKNQDIRIGNDCFEWVGNDRHLVIKQDQKEKVENDRHEEVIRDHVEKIGRDRNLKIIGKEAKAVDGTLSLTVKDDVIEVFKANHSEQVTGDYYVKAENVCIEATSNITIKVGQSFIAIESGGIKVGTTGDIALESKGNINQEATQKVTVKGTAGLTLESPAPAELKSSAILTINGSLVKIN